jgi:ATP-dependent HslUV protease ATP-binding subunit HslU
MNEQNENIGARRLNTIMEKVLEELNFSASERKGGKVVVDAAYVSQHIGELINNRDLSRYIL